MLGLQWVGQSLLAIILVCSLHTRTMSNAALTTASVIVEEIVYSWSTPNKYMQYSGNSHYLAI